MAISKLKAKFPCGYEIDTEVRTIWGHLRIDGNFPECPLHGKKCKKETEKR